MSFHCCTSLICNSFQPLNHTKHYAHRDETDNEEDGPADPDGVFVVNQRTYP